LNGTAKEATERLHVRSEGAGSPEVVLVHGFGASSFFWRRWIPRLRESHRVHCVELLGAGASAAPSGADYSPGAQAHRLASVLSTLGVSRPVLVGHSLGGGIAVLAALLLRDEASPIELGGLVLVSAAVYPQPLPRYLTLARVPGLGLLFLAAPPPRTLLRRGLREIVRRTECIDAEMVEGYRSPYLDRARRSAILRTALQLEVREAEAFVHRLPELDLPALVIWGDSDPIVPLDLGARLAGDLPHAELVTLPEVGHLPPEEEPEGSLAPVLDFLRRVQSGEASSARCRASGSS
jgi:pimeloyl-ACP methyl ester carboxylesterase